MKLIKKYKVLIIFIVAVLSINYLNALVLKEDIKKDLHDVKNEQVQQKN